MEEEWTVEPFIDSRFLETYSSTVKHLTSLPEKGKICFQRQKDYEGIYTSYFNTIQKDDGSIYLFYRAADKAHQLSCIAKIEQDERILGNESQEFERVGEGNNVLYKGRPTNAFLSGHSAHAFFAFRDPGQMSGTPYKGIARTRLPQFPGNDVIDLYESNNCLKWTRLQTIISPVNNSMRDFNNSTGFDTLNNIVYDKQKHVYRAYLRHNIAAGYRHIQTSTSQDLLEWAPFKEINLDNQKQKYNIYAPNVVAYPNSPYFLGLSQYQNGNDHSTGYVSLLFSRDGESWTNPLERKQLIPDISYPHNVSCSLIEQGTKFIIYVERLYGLLTTYSFRKHGIRYLTSEGENVGEILSKPLIVGGELSQIDLYANFERTSERGYLKFDIMDLDDVPVLESDCLYEEDEFDLPIHLKKNGKDINKLEFCRLRITLQNIKLYSIRYKGFAILE